MLNIPFNFVLINPVTDIFLFIFLTYLIVFPFYKKMLMFEIHQISWIDLKISLIFILFGYLNYTGIKLKFFSFEEEWFFWIIIIQLIIEGIFVFIYWEDVKIWWNRNNIKKRKTKKELLEHEMLGLEIFEDVFNDDFKNALKDPEKNKKQIKEIKNEIKRIKISKKKVEKELLKIQKKNDKKK